VYVSVIRAGAFVKIRSNMFWGYKTSWCKKLSHTKSHIVLATDEDTVGETVDQSMVGALKSPQMTEIHCDIDIKHLLRASRLLILPDGGQ